MGQARAAFGGEIGGELDLLATAAACRDNSRAPSSTSGWMFLRRAVVLGLGEDAGEGAEDLQEGGNGGVVEGHVMLVSWFGRKIAWMVLVK